VTRAGSLVVGCRSGRRRARSRPESHAGHRSARRTGWEDAAGRDDKQREAAHRGSRSPSEMETAARGAGPARLRGDGSRHKRRSARAAARPEDIAHSQQQAARRRHPRIAPPQYAADPLRVGAWLTSHADASAIGRVRRAGLQLADDRAEQARRQKPGPRGPDAFSPTGGSCRRETLDGADIRPSCLPWIGNRAPSSASRGSLREAAPRRAAGATRLSRRSAPGQRPRPWNGGPSRIARPIVPSPERAPRSRPGRERPPCAGWSAPQDLDHGAGSESRHDG